MTGILKRADATYISNIELLGGKLKKKKATKKKIATKKKVSINSKKYIRDIPAREKYPIPERQLIGLPYDRKSHVETIINQIEDKVLDTVLDSIHNEGKYYYQDFSEDEFDKFFYKEKNLFSVLNSLSDREISDIYDNLKQKIDKERLKITQLNSNIPVKRQEEQLVEKVWSDIDEDYLKSYNDKQIKKGLPILILNPKYNNLSEIKPPSKGLSAINKEDDIDVIKREYRFNKLTALTENETNKLKNDIIEYILFAHSYLIEEREKEKFIKLLERENKKYRIPDNKKTEEKKKILKKKTEKRIEREKEEKKKEKLETRQLSKFNVEPISTKKSHEERLRKYTEEQTRKEEEFINRVNADLINLESRIEKDIHAEIRNKVNPQRERQIKQDQQYLEELGNYNIENPRVESDEDRKRNFEEKKKLENKIYNDILEEMNIDEFNKEERKRLSQKEEEEKRLAQKESEIVAELKNELDEIKHKKLEMERKLNDPKLDREIAIAEQKKQRDYQEMLKEKEVNRQLNEDILREGHRIEEEKKKPKSKSAIKKEKLALKKKKERGFGLFDSLKKFGKNVANVFTNSSSPSLDRVEKAYYPLIITRIQIYRTPVEQIPLTLLKAISLGNFDYKSNFDKLYHLYCVLELANETKTGFLYQLTEKTPNIVWEDRQNLLSMATGAEQMIYTVPSTPIVRFGSMIEQLKKNMGQTLTDYTASQYNCQDYILNILKATAQLANTTLPTSISNFIYQDISKVLAPSSTTSKIANKVTDLSHVLNRIGHVVGIGTGLDTDSNIEISTKHKSKIDKLISKKLHF